MIFDNWFHSKTNIQTPDIEKGHTVDLNSLSAVAAEEGPTYEKVRNAMFAAELSMRIGDSLSAKQFYKEVDREDLARDVKIVSKVHETDFIEFQIESLMRKVIRWLSVKEEWQNNAPPGAKTSVINIGAFPIYDEPEYKFILNKLNSN